MLTSYQRRVYLHGAIGVHNSLADLRQDGAAAALRGFYNGSAMALIEIGNENPGLLIRQFQRATGGGNRAGPRDLLQDGDLARADLASGCPNALLGGYRGILQCDGYSAYKKFGGSKSADPAVTLAFCWSDVRRGFYDLAKAKAPIAIEAELRVWFEAQLAKVPALRPDG